MLKDKTSYKSKTLRELATTVNAVPLKEKPTPLFNEDLAPVDN